MSIFRYILKFLAQVLFRVKTVNLEKLNLDGRVIIMPNHVSLLDSFFLYLFLPKRAVYVVNIDVSKRFSFFMKFIKHISVDQYNPYAIKEIINQVEKEVPLIIFPEGRITTTGNLMRVHHGVGFIALKTGATVYPLIINGLEYSKFSRIKKIVKSRWFPKVQLYLDDPIKLMIHEGRSIQDQRKEAADHLYVILEKALFKSRYKDKVNLFNELLQVGAIHGWSKEVVEDTNQKLTYKKLILVSYILANKFKEVLGAEEKVGLLLPNVVAHVSTLFALFYLNKTPAILNFSSGTKNILDCAETTGIKKVITSREFVEKGGFEQLIEQLSQNYQIIYLEDIGATVVLKDKLKGLVKWYSGSKAQESSMPKIILFTSGTENKPKGVILTHKSILANIIQATCRMDFNANDTLFNALPMFHSFGLTAGTILPILKGAKSFLYPSPLNYKIIPELTYEVNATVILGTSTFFAGYGKYAEPYDFYSIRYAIVGAERLKDEVRELWHEKFGIRILEGYGCTETSPILALNTPLYYKRGSVGLPLPGIEYKIEKVEGMTEGGKFLVKGANVMEGYLIHGQGFIPAEEWYDTGDIVTIDEIGFLTITSRFKRFAKICGEMVSLNKVEELAEKCFGSENSYAAINLPDNSKGERIVLISTDKDLTLKSFREFIRKNQYSGLLSPESILYLEEIPLLGSGKTDYISLIELVTKE